MKKKKRRKRHGRPFYTFSVFLIVLLFVGLALAENMILHPMAKVYLSGIDSEYAILVDAGTGFKLAGKAEKEQMYTASMTKIMTYIVTAETVSDLQNTRTTVPESVAEDLEGTGSSLEQIQTSESFTIYELLNLMIVPSAYDDALTPA